MQIYHNSRDIECRKPFGAVATGERVVFSVKTDVKPQRMWLRLWRNSETLVEMECVKESEEGFWFSVEICMPEEPCLLWYFFVAELWGEKVHCCKGFGGMGVTGDCSGQESWQITVFRKGFSTPDWFKHSVMYQIFPDRFYKKGEVFEIPEKKGEYIIHRDWYEPVMCNRHPFENGPACNDFFGGNLQGIIEKIPYLKELGIGVIYLNPIFEAFSNHRYDTGDYKKIDPVLGTEEDFRELCEKCEAEGIRIILDGVFSHTGSDSIYFNKYGNYGQGVGAYNSPDSPFRSWFQWCDEGEGYRSWWGCSNLPNVCETEESYLDYILRDEDSVVKKWLRCGASGWRLDVADELPDEFIKILRREVKSQSPDAVVIGEVWEDASNKESYGQRREYLFGDELDSVMNYPFKDSVIAFLTESIDAEIFSDGLMTLAEHYPMESLYSAMNLLGTHDTMRVKTILGGQYINEEMSFEEKSRFRLEPQNETLALNRLKIGAFLQMTFAGVPCIYYGDEIGMQGLRDPFNRMPYSWRSVDPELFEHYKRLIGLRNSLDCLRTGLFLTILAKGGVFAFERKIENGKDVFKKPAKNGRAVCVVNRTNRWEEVVLPLDGVRELSAQLSDEKISLQDGMARLSVPPFGCEIYLCR